MTAPFEQGAKQETSRAEAGLFFPVSDVPDFGTPLAVAPGIFWLRMPLPFRLDHVNLYLIEDRDGWTIFDTGIADNPSRQLWENLFAGPLAGRPVQQIIVSHYHPDHIGLAGWLSERLAAPLVTSQTTYLSTTNISLRPGALEAPPYLDFYLRNGAPREMADIVTTSGHSYLRMVTPLPPTFRRIAAGDTIAMGERAFEVLVGEGHAPEQLMLYSAADKILLAADQVIEKITPNIGVWAVDPDGDPLGLYLRSLAMLETSVAGDSLVLAGHRLPFIGLHERCRQIADHHNERCRLIDEACKTGDRTVFDLVPVLFPRQLDPHQLSFAFSETLAHVNYMVENGILRWTSTDGTRHVAIAN